MSDITICTPDFVIRDGYFDEMKEKWTEGEKKKK